MYALEHSRIHRPRPAPAWRRHLLKWMVGTVVFAFLGFGFAEAAHGGGPTAYETVIVEPGDTLWAIASERYPNADVRAKVGEIEKANGLSGPVLQPGQSLRVPTS